MPDIPSVPPSSAHRPYRGCGSISTAEIKARIAVMFADTPDDRDRFSSSSSSVTDPVSP